MGYYLTEHRAAPALETRSADRPRLSAKTPIGAPFGKAILSTKYWDADTKTLAFQLRDYGPSIARWLSRDPIEERGGRNLFAFCKNNPLNKVDYIGLQANTCSVASAQLPGSMDKSTISNAGTEPEYLANVFIEIIIIGPTEPGGEGEDSPITPPGGILIGQGWFPMSDDVKNGTPCRKKNICKGTCKNPCCEWTIEWQEGFLKGRVESELVNDFDPDGGYKNASCDLSLGQLEAGLSRCKNSNPSCQ